MARVGERLGGLLSGAGMLLWPVVLLAGVRLALFGRFGSTHALVDDWYNHAQYLPLFLLGFWPARADVVWDRMRALRRTALWLALASYAFLSWYMVRSSGTDLPPAALRLFQSPPWGLNPWTPIVADPGLPLPLCPRHTPPSAHPPPSASPAS